MRIQNLNKKNFFTSSIVAGFLLAIVVFFLLKFQQSDASFNANIPFYNYGRFESAQFLPRLYLCCAFAFIWGFSSFGFFISLTQFRRFGALGFFCRMIFVLLISFLFVSSLPWAFVPSELADANSSHDWARRVFEGFYSKSVSYVVQSESLKSEIGEVISAVPILGLNRVISTPTTTTSRFTLAVQGERGTAICKTTLQYFFSRDWVFIGEFEQNGEKKRL